MNSINQNQAENNHADLDGSQAVKKIQDLVDKAQNCFFCTGSDHSNSFARPMNVRKVDDSGDLWFLSANDSHTNQQINLDAEVKLLFQGSPHSDFLELKGTATLSADAAKIHELWEPQLKTWFTEGETDPRITVIQVHPTEGYYWDTKHGNMVAGLKILVGAALGKTLDDSIEGRLHVA